MKPLFPLCIEAFDDYVNMANTCKLSRLEIERIHKKQFAKAWFTDEGKPTREETEFQGKLEQMGLQE